MHPRSLWQKLIKVEESGWFQTTFGKAQIGPFMKYESVQPKKYESIQSNKYEAVQQNKYESVKPNKYELSQPIKT